MFPGTTGIARCIVSFREACVRLSGATWLRLLRQNTADEGTSDLQAANDLGFANAHPVELSCLLGVEAAG